MNEYLLSVFELSGILILTFGFLTILTMCGWDSIFSLVSLLASSIFDSLKFFSTPTSLKTGLFGSIVKASSFLFKYNLGNILVLVFLDEEFELNKLLLLLLFIKALTLFLFIFSFELTLISLLFCEFLILILILLSSKYFLTSSSLSISFSFEMSLFLIRYLTYSTFY